MAAAEESGPDTDPEALGAALARALRALGADEILAALGSHEG
jgi:hypothetical protein